MPSFMLPLLRLFTSTLTLIAVVAALVLFFFFLLTGGFFLGMIV